MAQEQRAHNRRILDVDSFDSRRPPRALRRGDSQSISTTSPTITTSCGESAGGSSHGFTGGSSRADGSATLPSKNRHERH